MQCTLFISGNYNQADEVRFLQGGKHFFDQLLMLIRSAEEEIHLQLYSLENDDTGALVLQALLDACRRNVRIYLLLDAYGSRHLRRRQISELRKAGIFCRLFSPFVYGKFRMGRRLHHKILVVDGRTAIVGSMNIADKYRGTAGGPTWLDFAIRLDGPIATDIRQRCLRLVRPRTPAPAPAAQEIPNSRRYAVRLVQNDWFRHKRTINNNVREAVRFARHQLLIVSSYFIPSFRLVRLLQKAAERGVEVKLFVQGLSDVPLARNATRYWYRALMRKGIAVFEFPRNILHAKMILADGLWLSMGSYNFNHLSDYTSIESNVEVLDAHFYQSVIRDLAANQFQAAVRVNPDHYLHRLRPWPRFKWWLSHILANLLMRLLFAFTSRRG